jgi:hypothetical protein
VAFREHARECRAGMLRSIKTGTNYIYTIFVCYIKLVKRKNQYRCSVVESSTLVPGKSGLKDRTPRYSHVFLFLYLILLIFIKKSSSDLSIIKTERDFFFIELLFSHLFFYLKNRIIVFKTIIG